MKFSSPIPIQDIAQRIGAEIIGNDQVMATGINEIHQVEEGDITFVDVKKYFDKSLNSRASIVILNERVEAPPGKTLPLCANPFEAYDGLVQAFRPRIPLTSAIHETAVIDPSTVIEPNVVVGPHVTIGRNCYISANVVIAEYTVVGDNVLIQPGAIIGTEAFYFKRTEKGFQKWRSGGRVVLEDDVEIGAGCTINKGVSGDTIIGAGTKLDSQVHIGHDVRVGKRCLLVAQVGIGGNTVIGDEVVLYGQAGIAQNLHVGDKVVVGAKSGVSKDLESGKTYLGYPAGEAGVVYRELAALRNLPEFFKKHDRK